MNEIIELLAEALDAVDDIIRFFHPKDSGVNRESAALFDGKRKVSLTGFTTNNFWINRPCQHGRCRALIHSQLRVVVVYLKSRNGPSIFFQ